MVALLDAMEAADYPARCVLVLSNVPDAPGLAAAASRGVPTAVVDHKAFASRGDHEAKVLATLLAAHVDYVCLAGYMRLLSPVLIGAFRNRILNIHPALLPSFPGLHVQRKALEHGVRFSGCTVHLVDEEVDHGPILLQAAVPVFPGDDEAALSARILGREHRLYAEALRLLCEDRFLVEGRRASLRMTDEEFLGVMHRIDGTGDAS